MQVALISDIHGNAVALDAVLSEIDDVNPDQIVCLGDVATGPQPSEALDRIQQLGCPVVMGNADEGLIDPQTFTPQSPENTNETFQRIKDIGNWCTEQLSDDQLQYVRSFDPTVEVSLDDETNLLCYHGSPNTHSERIEATTSEATLDELFAGVEATVLAGGHIHNQFVRHYKDMIVLNPGSIGMSYEEDRATGELCNPPWGEYALVTRSNGSFSIDLRRTAFDAAMFGQTTHKSDMPHAEWYAEGWLADQ